MTSDSWRVDRLNWNTSLPSMTPGEFEKTNWKTDERKNKLFDFRTSEEDDAYYLSMLLQMYLTAFRDQVALSFFLSHHFGTFHTNISLRYTFSAQRCSTSRA